MREAIVRHTFPNKEEYAATPWSTVDRLRTSYLSGRLRAQYVTLRYLGYNKPLQDALKALNAMDTARRKTPSAKRTSTPSDDEQDEFHEDDGDEPVPKRARS